MSGHRRRAQAEQPGVLSKISEYARECSSAVLAFYSAAMAYAYSQPGLAIAPPQAGRVSIVAFIDGIGPVWLGLFGVSAMLLLAGVLTTSAVTLRVAHALSTGVVGCFDVALWLGWWFSLPPRPTIVAALTAAAVVMWHFLMAQVYVPSLPMRRRMLDDDGEERV